MDRVGTRLRFRLPSFRSALYRSALSLIASEAASAGLGLGFWVLVARLYLDRDAGVGAVLITSATLLASASTLGLNLGLIRFLPEVRGRQATMVNASATVSAIVAAGLAGAFAVGADLWSPVVGFLARDAGAFLLFVGFVAVWSVHLVFDAAFVGLGAAKFVLVRALVYGGLKLLLPLALVPTLSVPIGLFSAWGLGLLGSNALAVGLLFGRVIPEYLPRLQMHVRAIAPMFRFAIANHATTLLAGLPGLVYPLLITRSFPPENAVYFYVAWTIAGILHLVPGSIFLSVFAEGSRERRELRQSTRSGLTLAFALLAPAIVATLLASDRVLVIAFRSSYAPTAPILNILVLTSVPATMNLAYAASLRVHKRLRPLFLLYATISLASVGLGYVLLLPAGPVGVAYAFAIVQISAAAFSVRALFREGTLGRLAPAVREA